MARTSLGRIAYGNETRKGDLNADAGRQTDWNADDL